MEQLIDDAKMITHWNIKLPELGRKFSAKGTFSIVANPDATSKRIIEGDIQVNYAHWDKDRTRKYKELGGCLSKRVRLPGVSQPKSSMSSVQR